MIDHDAVDEIRDRLAREAPAIPEEADRTFRMMLYGVNPDGTIPDPDPPERPDADERHAAVRVLGGGDK